jgi:hypothetical protein
MSLSSRPLRKLPRFADQSSRNKGKGNPTLVRDYLAGIAALRRAVTSGTRSAIRIDGKAVAVLPLEDFRRLERLLEREATEKALDRLDFEEAERILADPTQIPIPYEQVRRELGFGDLPD